MTYPIETRLLVVLLIDGSDPGLSDESLEQEIANMPVMIQIRLLSVFMIFELKFVDLKTFLSDIVFTSTPI